MNQISAKIKLSPDGSEIEIQGDAEQVREILSRFPDLQLSQPKASAIAIAEIEASVKKNEALMKVRSRFLEEDGRLKFSALAIICASAITLTLIFVESLPRRAVYEVPTTVSPQ